MHSSAMVGSKKLLTSEGFLPLVSQLGSTGPEPFP